MRAVWVSALILLAACQPEAPAGPPGQKLGATARAECLAAGGRVGRGGILPGEVCFRPTPDAGRACTRATDCSGHCMADSRTCSPVTPQFGCFAFLDETGQNLSICVD